LVRVVCLKWGDKYGPEYVNRLFEMVSRHLTLPFSFTCLTDDMTGLKEDILVQALPDMKLKGWWYKLLIFKSGFLTFKATDKVLFLDLDIVILGSLDPLVQLSDKLCIAADDEPDRYNSSVMCFSPDKYHFIWDSFEIQSDKIVRSMHGDQDWIEYVYQDAAVYPKQLIKSFKVDLKSKTPFSFGKWGRFFRKKMPLLMPKGEVPFPEKTSIVLFHGKPDPEDVMYGPYDKYRYAPWVKQAWLENSM